MKNIVICADGTWNRPEKNIREDIPTNVLLLARGIANNNDDGIKQVVYYDWGVGSYHDQFAGGALGHGLEKNIKDCYRFLVQNYEPGDNIYLFGFSRGAYTIRSLCGMINNCSILKSAEGRMVEDAFQLYKTKKYKPKDTYSKLWRDQYAVEDKTTIRFVGVWDTVGAMGLPFSFFGLIKKKHLFYDNKLGSNIETARHALALDELREDFTPTIWQPRPNVDLKQVWFAGNHADVGGSYKADKDGNSLSYISLEWMCKEAMLCGLAFKEHLTLLKTNPLAQQHNEYKGGYLALGKKERVIPKAHKTPTFIHQSVKERYEKGNYKSKPIEQYIKANGKWPAMEHTVKHHELTAL